MLEIRITISAPELTKAISNLASALNGKKVVDTPAPSKYIEQTVSPEHSIEQIMQSGAALMDAGKINELTSLLQSFGVQAVMQLKPEQLDAFAAAMRDLGAKI